MEHSPMRKWAHLLGGTAALALLCVPANAQFSGNLPPGSVLGNATASAAPARPVPATDGTILIAGGAIAARVFGTAQSGIVPLSGGGTTNYLRADGTWAEPPGTATGLGNCLTANGVDGQVCNSTGASAAWGSRIIGPNGTGSGDGTDVVATAGTGGATGGGGGVLIDAGQAGATSGLGGGVRIRAGSSATLGEGGNVNVLAGNSAGATSGGNINMTAGNAGATGSEGGFVNILAGGAAVGNGGAVTIEGGATNTGDGGKVEITSGSPLVSGNGGEIQVQAGPGVVSGLGGLINLRAGDSAGVSNPGGDITIRSGDGDDEDWASSVEITAGAASLGQRGGRVIITAGAGTTGQGGPFVIKGGTSDSDTPGPISITGGDTAGVGAVGGPINITGGFSDSGTGGAININGGAGTPNGAINLAGDINLTDTISCTGGSALQTDGSGKIACGVASGSGLYAQVRSATPTASSTGLSTSVNLGTATATDGATGYHICGATNAGQLEGKSKTAPATPYNIDAIIQNTPYGATAGFGMIFGWYDGTKLQVFLSGVGDPSNVTVVDYATVASGAAASSVRATITGGSGTHALGYRLKNDGTNVYFQIAPGADFSNAQTVYTVAIATAQIANYNTLIYGINANNGATCATMLSYAQS